MHNKDHPEGSIAEGFLAQESLTFCSRYLTGVETIFTRALRNDDEGHQNEIEESNDLCPGHPLGRKIQSGSLFQKRRTSSTIIDEIQP